MSVTDDLLANARGYAQTFSKGELPLPPAKQIAIVAWSSRFSAACARPDHWRRW